LQVVVCNARVLGLGPRFMSVYVPKLAVQNFIISSNGISCIVVSYHVLM
jgi:hypothetical protein